MRTRIPWVGIVVAAAGATILFAPAPAAAVRWILDVESGAVWSGYNDVRIPPDTGTEFSLSEELEIDPEAFFRVRLGCDLRPRHHVSVLVAPLHLSASGSRSSPTVFEGVEFPGATPLEGVFRFDSYRVTYRYDFYARDRLTAGLGFTGKIRDAEIRLEGDGLSSAKTNTGFVPLINFRLDWAPARTVHLLVEGDALAAPQGRAEDVFLGAGYALRPVLFLRAGYRFLEGGADVEEVYNFAWLHYASAGLSFGF
jgi:hypothetical protein